MRKPITVIAAVGVLALGLAAYGAVSGHAAAAPSRSAGAAAAITRLTLSAPTSGALMFSTSTLKAREGTVRITFVNHSPEPHNFTLVRGARGARIGATPTFVGGSKTLTVHLRAGRYTYYCSVPGHRQAGMQGTLTVR